MISLSLSASFLSSSNKLSTLGGNNPARHLIRPIFDSTVQSIGAPSFAFEVRPRFSSALNYDPLPLFRNAVGAPPPSVSDLAVETADLAC